ncbi:MAG TPA: acyltransferase [Micromonosporaceae bacterium]|nr:acyltransferase [Micromonosporaceae bacterium]
MDASVEVTASPPQEGVPLTHVGGRRLHVIDLFRFAAAALVLGYHVVAPSDVWQADTGQLFTYPFRQFFRYGWMGVEFFFIISGFVICMSAWGRTVADFFVSRFARLMPAYVLAVLATTALLASLPWGEPPTTPQVLVNLAMLQGLLGYPHIDSVYWTLLVELKFYFLFTFVILFGLSYRRAIVFCVVWLAGAQIALATGDKHLTILLEPRYASYFVAGIALHLMYRFGPDPLLWCLVAVSWLLGAASLDGRINELVGVGERVNFGTALPLMTTFYLVMLAATLGWLSRVRWRGLVHIGALTYPVYLLHKPFSHAVIHEFHHRVPALLLLGCTVAGVLALAYAVHRLVERPLAPLVRKGLRASLRWMRLAPASSPGHQA